MLVYRLDGIIWVGASKDGDKTQDIYKHDEYICEKYKYEEYIYDKYKFKEYICDKYKGYICDKW